MIKRNYMKDLSRLGYILKPNIRFFIIILQFFLISQNLCAQLKQISPEKEGFSSVELQKIDSMFQSYTDSHKIAGGVALIARHGHIVYHKPFGYNNIEEQRLMKKTDMFRVASQTKIVTGIAVMILYDEGKISLIDPISKYLPTFKKPRVLESFDEQDTTYTSIPAHHEITIHELLTHTSGIAYPIISTKESRAIYGKAGIPIGFEPRNLLLAERMEKLAELPLMYQPGEAWIYGLNMDVLGYLVEKVSGMSLSDFFHKKIFEPLGMHDTYFYVPYDQQKRLAKVYDSKNGELIENNSNDAAGINTIYPLVEGTYYSGGGGLCSTAYDFAILMQMLMDEGIYEGHRILSPLAVKLMTTNQIGEGMRGWNSKDTFGYTVGIVTKKDSDNSWNPGTFYWGGFWGSIPWADPKAGIVVQLWVQTRSLYWHKMSETFKEMVYSALNNP